ncbi:hypothetical protein SDC9_167792 [bioreactor metagenome]|uniref:Uncharacterized protein n=1 Tax=bioreactor metagenome TaxID=1076179 RepID=A0A645G919_9ZZZZ
MGEQVERLEDHPDLGAQLGQLLALRREPASVDGDRARIDRLQPVDRPDQCRLARAGRAQDHHHLALRHRQVDVAQHVQVTEVLVDVLQDDDRCADLMDQRSGVLGVDRCHDRTIGPVGSIGQGLRGSASSIVPGPSHDAAPNARPCR